MKNESISYDSQIAELKQKLAVAVEEQNFELAAQIRDEINEISQKGGNA